MIGRITTIATQITFIMVDSELLAILKMAKYQLVI